MARDPGSLWAPLPEAGTQGHYVKSQLIVHSTGDRLGAAATARYFAGPTPNESTFVVGLTADDPTRQLLDSAERADANVAANQDAISVEVVGQGGDPFTAWQCAELVRLGLWAMTEHPAIRPQVIPSPKLPGFGWHVMFGAPGPWTTAAKVCPGPARIEQLKTVIFPAIFAGIPATTTPTDEDDDMRPRLYSAKGHGTIYFGAPGVWKATPNTDWLTTAKITWPDLQLVTLPSVDHLRWARDGHLSVLAGKENTPQQP